MGRRMDVFSSTSQPAYQPANQTPPILQNIQNGISQHPLIRYSSNFKLKLMEQTKIENDLKLRRPTMEDDLKLLELEYLINH
jgi:hypothetical protein